MELPSYWSEISETGSQEHPMLAIYAYFRSRATDLSGITFGGLALVGLLSVGVPAVF